MNYVLIAVGAYLVVGIIMTYNVLKIPRRSLRVWDVAVGAVIMPVLSTVLFLCVLFEPLWKRLLIALDYNPPEDMRAGPKPPADGDSGKA